MKQESGPTNNPVQLRAEDLDNLKELNEAFLVDLGNISDGTSLMHGVSGYAKATAELIASLDKVGVSLSSIGLDPHDQSRRKTAISCLALITFLYRFLHLKYGLNVKTQFESGDIGKAASELIEKFGIDLMPEGGGLN